MKALLGSVSEKRCWALPGPIKLLTGFVGPSTDASRPGSLGERVKTEALNEGWSNGEGDLVAEARGQVSGDRSGDHPASRAHCKDAEGRKVGRRVLSLSQLCFRRQLETKSKDEASSVMLI